MKNVGIVGLPGAGSSTIFTALTALEGAAPGKSNQAVVPVPDARVDKLTELHESRKTVYATLRFVETSGQVRRGSRGAAGSTFDHVAHVAGVSRGLLHYYFGSKERLLVEVVRRDSELRMASLERGLDQADSIDAIVEVLVRGLRDYVAEEDVDSFDDDAVDDAGPEAKAGTRLLEELRVAALERFATLRTTFDKLRKALA